jgi:hypothetical protein
MLGVLAPTAVILLIRVGALPDVLRPVGASKPSGRVILVFLVAGGFGSVYDIYEWFSDLHFGTHYQPDNFDTMTDMTAGPTPWAVSREACSSSRRRGAADVTPREVERGRGRVRRVLRRARPLHVPRRTATMPELLGAARRRGGRAAAHRPRLARSASRRLGCGTHGASGPSATRF